MLEEKLLKLLGMGVSPSVAASTVGCDPSFVSQLLAREDFAVKVAEMRCANLEAATSRDSKYDSIEDQLLEKLENVLPFMLKPRDILDAITKVNSAKRRGAVPLTNIDETKQTIINLTLPVSVLQKFSMNGQGEVIQVENRPLVNMPAVTLMKSLEDRRAAENEQGSRAQINLSTEQSKRSVYTEDSV